VDRDAVHWIQRAVEAHGAKPDVVYPSGVPGKRPGAGLMPESLTNTPDFATLVALGKHLNYTERRSSDAEREIRATGRKHTAQNVVDEVGILRGAGLAMTRHFANTLWWIRPARWRDCDHPAGSR